MSDPWLTRRGHAALVTCLLLLALATPVVAQEEQDTARGAEASAAAQEPPPLTSLGADRESFSDGFDVPGAWGVGDDQNSRIAYEDGALAIKLKRDGSGITTTRRPTQASPGMRLEIDVELGADGSSAGPMCGSRAQGSDFFFGVVNTGDDWYVGRTADTSGGILASGHLEGIDIITGSPVRLALECATTDEGHRVAFWVGGQLVGEVSGVEPRGPYDRVGVYADATTGGSVVRFDDAVAFDAGPVPGLLTLGANVEALRDDFSVPGAWGTVADEVTRIDYEDDALAITALRDRSGRWTTATLPWAANEVRLDIDAQIGSGASAAGPMCISTGEEPEVTFAVVDRNAVWSIGRIVAGSASVVDRGPLEELLVSPDRPVRLALECAVTDEGDRTALWVEDQLVADLTSTRQHGPYDAVGVYADALSSGGVVRFDDAVVLTGDPISILSSLGADQLVLEETFDDRSRWSTGKARQGRVTYGNGTLRIALRLPRSSLWSYQRLLQAQPVMRMEGTVKAGDGKGDAGYLCGAPGDHSPLYYAVIGTKGEAAVGIVRDAVMSELVRVRLPSEVKKSNRHRLVVECAAADPSTDRVAVWVDGVLVVDHRPEGSLASFARAGVYAESDSRRFDAAFDDVNLSVGMSYAPVGDVPAIATE